MLWAYFSFSQFLIIWSGNLPEEIPFYLERLRGGWQYVVAAHPARPLRAAVRAAALAGSEAAAAACSRRSPSSSSLMRVVDLIWLVEPMFGHAAASRSTGWTSRCRSGLARRVVRSCSRAICAAGRCCRSTIRSSRRRSRMTPTDRATAARTTAARRVAQPGRRRTRTADINIRTRAQFGVGMVGVVVVLSRSIVLGAVQRARIGRRRAATRSVAAGARRPGSCRPDRVSQTNEPSRA